MTRRYVPAHKYESSVYFGGRRCTCGRQPNHRCHQPYWWRMLFYNAQRRGPMPLYLYAPKRRTDPYTAVHYEGSFEPIEAWLKYLGVTPQVAQVRWERAQLYIEGVRAEPDCYIGYDTNGLFSIWQRREFEDNYETIV